MFSNSCPHTFSDGAGAKSMPGITGYIIASPHACWKLALHTSLTQVWVKPHCCPSPQPGCYFCFMFQPGLQNTALGDIHVPITSLCTHQSIWAGNTSFALAQENTHLLKSQRGIVFKNVRIPNASLFIHLQLQLTLQHPALTEIH